MFGMVKPLQCANPFHQTTCHLSRKNIYSRIFLFSSLRQDKKKEFYQYKKTLLFLVSLSIFLFQAILFSFPKPGDYTAHNATWPVTLHLVLLHCASSSQCGLQ